MFLLVQIFETAMQLNAMTGQQVDTLFFSENLGPANHQVLDVPLGICNVVRHPTGAVGDISCFFEYGYVDAWVISFHPTGGAHAGGIATDDQDPHITAEISSAP